MVTPKCPPRAKVHTAPWRSDHRRTRITPTKNAIANDWMGASRVAALSRSSNPGRGATSSARAWDMPRIASTALLILTSASAVGTGMSSFVMKAETHQHIGRSSAHRNVTLKSRLLHPFVVGSALDRTYRDLEWRAHAP